MAWSWISWHTQNSCRSQICKITYLCFPKKCHQSSEGIHIYAFHGVLWLHIRSRKTLKQQAWNRGRGRIPPSSLVFSKCHNCNLFKLIYYMMKTFLFFSFLSLFHRTTIFFIYYKMIFHAFASLPSTPVLCLYSVSFIINFLSLCWKSLLISNWQCLHKI